MRYRPKYESSVRCVAEIDCDIINRKEQREMAILAENFDAYGDALPTVMLSAHVSRKTASATFNRVGQIAFWLLVVVIVSARVIWYPAAQSFGAPGVFDGVSVWGLGAATFDSISGLPI
jgi:hypothetical protein